MGGRLERNQMIGHDEGRYCTLLRSCSVDMDEVRLEVPDYCRLETQCIPSGWDSGVHLTCDRYFKLELLDPHF